jgi:hypothetical protein
MLMSKIFFKKYIFHVFSNKKHFEKEKQPLPHSKILLKKLQNK